ncbi:PTS lactose/cellobiose transporter subunit IIA [Vibrio mangrovi]|uniref:N,N'-diacetylchitobiose-specific phosphotransferase enzyme IIA component n=1 Tax=Vibrio mangrovi TaxID=474394 RepID=A0A1Y6IT03_9VIBR|nr:PTS lactose/cellobiose transporter subunit IIA [Vibrio mangrovi]MDW6004487.1 PTS lactose/cellobiose transporter subunit IIA [Vibrio mangrovi]SMS00775.1 N,N'-diacetylchitobiose-specific phosphotransferase enzyme IIA component [Vibrio mangrovi]
MNLEMEIMEIITNAGESRSEAMIALQHAKANNWELADQALLRSKEAAKRAHKVQTALIGLDEGEGKVPVTLVMVHAQDHLMTSMLAVDLIKEMIEMYRR